MTEDKTDSRLQISDSRCVMFSINRPHTDNIKSGLKKSELRLRAPTVYRNYCAYIYETKRNGGCGKVIGKFIARNITGYKNLDIGVPMDLIRRACISNGELMKYTAGGEKEVTEIRIYNLLIYDKPRDVDEFLLAGKTCCDQKHCDKCWYMGTDGVCDLKDFGQPLFKPPQSWCYVEELICPF